MVERIVTNRAILKMTFKIGPFPLLCLKNSGISILLVTSNYMLCRLFMFHHSISSPIETENFTGNK
jgi:hypothetical protein